MKRWEWSPTRLSPVHVGLPLVKLLNPSPLLFNSLRRWIAHLITPDQAVANFNRRRQYCSHLFVRLHSIRLRCLLSRQWYLLCRCHRRLTSSQQQFYLCLPTDALGFNYTALIRHFYALSTFAHSLTRDDKFIQCSPNIDSAKLWFPYTWLRFYFQLLIIIILLSCITKLNYSSDYS